MPHSPACGPAVSRSSKSRWTSRGASGWRPSSTPTATASSSRPKSPGPRRRRDSRCTLRVRQPGLRYVSLEVYTTTTGVGLMSVRTRMLAVAASGLVLVAATVVNATNVYAAAAPTPLPASQFTLTSNYHQFDTLNDALVARLGTVPVHTVMDSANHDRAAITDSLGLAGYVGGFRFDSGDNMDCTNYPQGITSSRDAVGTADNGRYDGRQLILVSWYTNDGCLLTGTRSRITLVDWDANYPNKYRKVLLVEATGTTTAPSFKDIRIHAGGVSWYGNYLYVADTSRGMRVFDMRKILRTDPGGTSDQIGRQPDGT